MSTFKDRMASVRFNPANIQQVVLEELETQLNNNDYDVPDPSNPFVFLMEANILNGCMNLTQQESILRRLYPSMAISQEDLYLHMSDEDLIGRFSIPAETTFELFLPYDAIMARAVPVPDTGMRKLVIPRLTYFRVAETTFTMQYPIELRVMSHGGLQVVYDDDRRSPVQTLSTNMVDYDILNMRGQRMIRLQVPVKQFSVATYYETISPAAGFNVDYDFEQYFYYARVFLKTDNQTSWQEIKTTHTEQVYDPLVPTAVLQVLDQRLNVTIPMVYFTQGMIDGQIRVDVYTTRGPIELDLGSYNVAQFETKLVDIDDDSRYVAPLNTLSMMQALNAKLVSGGQRGVSFTTLREQVIQNTLGASRIPITNAQLENEMTNRGFELVTNIDNITNRQFLASKRLPQSSDGAVVSAMGCMMGLLQTSLNSIIDSPHVRDNGERITLLPSMLFQYHQGRIGVVADSIIEQLRRNTPDAIARQVNRRRYMYSPFHYVLDTTRNAFDLRPYYLDSPQIHNKTFIGDNDSVGLEVSVERYAIQRVPEGYQITLELASGNVFKSLEDDEIIVQVGYQPMNENSYASVNATFIGFNEQTDERRYRFVVETNYDLDQDDGLYTTNFSMFDLAQTDFAMALNQDLDISIVLSRDDVSQFEQSALDDIISRHLLPRGYVTVARERLNVTFGHALTGLWRRHRTLITEMSYEHYQEDVPYVHETTVYKRHPETGIIELNEDGEGNISPTVIHQKGDTQYNDAGQPIYRHLKGDRKLDGNGEPIMVAPRQLQREVNLFLVDGLYYFVTEANAIAYRQATPQRLIDWIQQDVDVLSDRLLEQSELFLYPTTTLGDTTARVRAGLETTMRIDQHVYVNYYLSNTAYTNTELRQALIQSTKQIVADILTRPTVAISELVARLEANAGEDVIAVEAGGLGGSNDYSVVSMTDDAARLSLGKRLTVLANQYLSVEDDIDITFLRHNLPTYQD